MVHPLGIESIPPSGENTPFHPGPSTPIMSG
jgi:hypothetical protein